MVEFSHKTGFIQIKEVVDIPKTAKVNSGSKTILEDEPSARLGLDDNLVKTMFDGGIKTVGHVIELVKGKHEKSLKELKIARARQKTIQQKLGLFYESEGVPFPM